MQGPMIKQISCIITPRQYTMIGLINVGPTILLCYDAGFRLVHILVTANLSFVIVGGVQLSHPAASRHI